MKKGFTLIEIIGIIILLGLIALLVYPTVVRIIGDSKDDLYNKNVSELERLAANWASINESKLPTIDKKGYYLKIEELKKDGFIDENVTNPKTGEPMQGCVEILYDKSKDRHDYKYYDNCDHFVKPILSGFTSNVLENEYGWRNKDFYINLESEYLDYYEYCIGDSKCSPNIRVDDPNAGILINQEGIKYVCAKGNNTVSETTEECTLYRLDKTAPVIGNIVLTGEQGLNGWYINDVIVSSTKSTDALSGIESNSLSPSETKVTVDTKGTTYTLTARDLAGNVSSTSYTIKLDKTKPVVGNLAINGTKGENDWYTSDLTFSVTDGSDLTSGHKSTTSNITSITSDTNGTNVIVTTMDNAGNSNTKTYVVKVDKTPPTPGTLVITGEKGFGEWYISDVVFSVTDGSDNLSGHATTTSSINSITTNTNGEEVIVTTKDKAGNQATRKYTVKVNKDKPTAGTLVIDGTKGENGWYVSYVNLSVKDVSGVTSTLNMTEIKKETSGTEVVMTSVNNQTGAKTITKHIVKIDMTPPTVGTLTINGTKGSNNWYTGNVTFSVNNGSDNLSGHASSVSSHTSLTSNTKGTNVVVTTKDMAGNTSTKTYTIKVDKTKPSITAKYTTVTIGSISEVNVSDLFTTTYSISGGSISCTVSKTANIKGVNNPLRCTATGGNGLNSSATIAVKNPLVSIAVTSLPNKTKYRYGDKFDQTGLVVTATYKDGTSKPVTGYTIDFNRKTKADDRFYDREFGFDYLPPSRIRGTRGVLDVSYTEDGITATTQFNIEVYVEADQVVKFYVVPAYYDIEKVTKWTNPSATENVETIYNADKNDYGYYELGSNYVETVNTKAGYIPTLTVNYYVLLTDGTYWDAGWVENDDDTTYQISVTHKITQKGSTAVWISVLNGDNTVATANNKTVTVDFPRGADRHGVTSKTGTSKSRHTYNSAKVNGRSIPIVVTDPNEYGQ